MKRITAGIIIALIGISITIYGLYVTTNLEDNRVFRMSGYALVLLGMIIAPDYRKDK
ncbi:hypothetical protein [Metabacillus litoralis]|uniref:hypothetical protein n=1 Tax=Metabacillus litoralis TaxID=152268 RepID=UPI001CFCC5F9|nr:hypothetical protein [Metabacillus litoralis]